MHKVLWIAGLSNGESIYEEKGNFATIKGELSPWQRLLSYIAEQGLTITSLSLYSADGRRWNIPSAGKNPKFKEFANAPKPVSFRMFRKLGADIVNEKQVSQDLYTVAEALYEDGTKLQMWVDNETMNAWSLIIKS